MNLIKYVLFVIAIIAGEILLTFGLFHFVEASKQWFIIFTFAVLGAIIIYLVTSRFREKIKITSSKDVLTRYSKNVLSIITFLIAVFAGCVIIKALTLLIF